MRFCILLRSARSEILVQSSSGFAEALKLLLISGFENWGGGGGNAWKAYPCMCCGMVNIVNVKGTTSPVEGDARRG